MKASDVVAIYFGKEFVEDVEYGKKTRTIRKVRKSGNPKKGDVLLLCWKPVEGNTVQLADGVCTKVRPVSIDYTGVVLDGKPLYAGDTPAYMGSPDPDRYDGDFARADGFQSFGDLADFIKDKYGLPFEGQLIEWRL